MRSEKQNCSKQAVSEENDLQALLAWLRVLVPLAFGTLANSLLKSVLRADLTIVSALNYGHQMIESCSYTELLDKALLDGKNNKLSSMFNDLQEIVHSSLS